MTKVWFNDIEQMHEKFGVNDWFEANKDNKELMAKYLAESIYENVLKPYNNQKGS